MLRNILTSALRSRTGGGVSTGTTRGYGSRSRSGGTDPGAQIGAQVGRSLFSALRRRR